jgi:hypothetical protein
MNIEEANKKYGSTEITFTSYYKYSFDYHGTGPDGEEIYCSSGGCADEIYRYDVDLKPIEVGNIEYWKFFSVKKDGETIFEYSYYE